MSDDAVSLAKLILSVRDDRAQFFDSSLFDEQAWELLLTLFVTQHEGMAFDREALIAKHVASAATLDRWIGLLTARDIIVCAPSGEIRLTDDAAARMEALLRSKVPTA